MIELLNELRVALPGVQILFAFLLTVPFSGRFETLTAFQRDVYYVHADRDRAVDRVPDRAVGRAPAALPPGRARLDRRVGQRAHDRRPRFLAVALSGSVLLITDLMFDGARVWIYTGAVAAVIVGLWFVRPLLRGVRGLSSGP